jgi:hypothetical protein
MEEKGLQELDENGKILMSRGSYSILSRRSIED